MANGHIEIHDPLSNQNGLSSKTADYDQKCASDTDSMEDTVEFKIMMAYAKRRRPKTEDARNYFQEGNLKLVAQCGNITEPSSPQTPVETKKEVKEEEKKEKKRKAGKRLLKIFGCIKPRIEDEEVPQTVAGTPAVPDRCGAFRNDKIQEDEFKDVATHLTEIADEIPFTPPEIEEDSSGDDVEKVIGLLLREAGDKLNEQELKDAHISMDLFLKYSFFKELVSTFLKRMGLVTSEPNTLGAQASPKTQIAVTCEVTSRLSALNTLPMNRMLNHGARYLQEYYSTWVKQQGGYEEAFHSDEEDDD